MPATRINARIDAYANGSSIGFYLITNQEFLDLLLTMFSPLELNYIKKENIDKLAKKSKILKILNAISEEELYLIKDMSKIDNLSIKIFTTQERK